MRNQVDPLILYTVGEEWTAQNKINRYILFTATVRASSFYFIQLPGRKGSKFRLDKLSFLYHYYCFEERKNTKNVIYLY